MVGSNCRGSVSMCIFYCHKKKKTKKRQMDKTQLPKRIYKFVVVWCKINMYIQYINLQDKSWITRYHTWYHRLSRTCIHTCYWNENQNWVDKLNMSRLVYKKYSDTSNIPYIFHIKQQFFKKIILQSILVWFW